MSIRFEIVVAWDKATHGIGYKGDLPWRTTDELLDWFSRVTRGKPVSDDLEKKDSPSFPESACWMGNNTWKSIAQSIAQHDGLSNRWNLVWTRDKDKFHATYPPETFPHVVCFSTWHDMMTWVVQNNTRYNLGNKVCVVGGKTVYDYAHKHFPHHIDVLHYTILDRKVAPVGVDMYYRPPQGYQEMFTLALSTVNGATYQCWKRNTHNLFDDAYSMVLRNIINHTALLPEPQRIRHDRTGVNTYSVFGQHMSFDLQHSFPLITTKQVALRHVFCELMWMIRGQTHVKFLQKEKVTIWNANSTRAFLDSQGLNHHPEGQLGPVYGFQWRHFNGNINLKGDDNKDAGGVDQLNQVIQAIRMKSTSRRIIMSAWNPSQLSEMALPPCHLLVQFYVSDDGSKTRLSCMLYMRSNDMFLGAPFNIAFYALLTCMLAGMCDLHPGILHITIGDAHIYTNHIEQVRTQLMRVSRMPPVLTFKRIPKEITDWEWNDIVLDKYVPHGKIDGKMAV